MRFQQNRHYVFFDSHCPMCSNWAMQILQWDTEGVFILISAHSTIAASWAKARGVDPNIFHKTIVYLQPNVFWCTEGDAVKKIAKNLKSIPLPFSFILWIAPKVIINGIYRFIAQNRKKKGKDCDLLLDKSIKDRIIL